MSHAQAETTLVLLRHGPTAWNEAGRIQGRSDQPLSDAGRREVKRWRLPSGFDRYDWVTSPLIRAFETAVLLGHPEATPVPALTEMDWGDWEGATLATLRHADPTGMAENEARGRDFRPAAGESPRDLQNRLRPWLSACAAEGRALTAVCHKGVIRALYALAADWDMTGPAADKLRDGCCHEFALSADGHPRVVRLNQPLVP